MLTLGYIYLYRIKSAVIRLCTRLADFHLEYFGVSAKMLHFTLFYFKYYSGLY